MVNGVLLDAGGVLIFPGLEFMLPPLQARGMPTDVSALERAHYHAMSVQDAAALPPAQDTWWHEYLLSYLTACGAGADACEPLAAEIGAIKGPHWTHVGTGVMDGLRALAALGIPLGVVSNSDGTVEGELARLGVCYARNGQDPARSDGVPVGIVVDSAVAGVAKPNPAIFGIALDALGVPADGTVLHVGDSLRYDVAGARAAGLQPVHMDPYRFCPQPDDHPHITSLAGLLDLIG